MKIYKSLQDRLETQHLSIAEIIGKAEAHRIVLKPAINKWSIHDNLAHLVRYQIIFIGRIEKIISENLPYFDRYKAENDPEFEKFRELSDNDLLKNLNEQRIKLNQFVFSLPESEFEKAGTHKKFGSLSLIQWLEFFILHEAHHLYTIFQLANDIDIK